MTRRPPLLALTLVLAGALTLSACTSTADSVAETAAPSTSPTASPTATLPASPLPEASPTDAADASAVAYSSCDDVITPAFRQMVSDNGWIGWNMVDQEIGFSPFDDFPTGAPAAQLSCRFGSGPDVATDNVLDLAWAPIDEAGAQSAQTYLAEAGFQRIDTTDGVQWSVRGDAGWADAEGWGQTYVFTGTDVRWAQIRDQLSYLQPAA